MINNQGYYFFCNKYQVAIYSCEKIEIAIICSELIFIIFVAM